MNFCSHHQANNKNTKFAKLLYRREQPAETRSETRCKKFPHSQKTIKVQFYSLPPSPPLLFLAFLFPPPLTPPPHVPISPLLFPQMIPLPFDLAQTFLLLFNLHKDHGMTIQRPLHSE